MRPELPMTLRPSRLKWALLLVVCLGFVAGATVMPPGPKPVLCGVFFGVGAGIAGIQLLPGASFLQLDRTGFTMKSLFRRHFWAWSEVARFGIAPVASRRMVCFDLRPGAGRRGVLAELNTGLVGFEAALPDLYGLSAEALADLLNACLAEAARAEEMERAIGAPAVESTQQIP